MEGPRQTKALTEEKENVIREYEGVLNNSLNFRYELWIFTFTATQ